MPGSGPLESFFSLPFIICQVYSLLFSAFCHGRKQRAVKSGDLPITAVWINKAGGGPEEQLGPLWATGCQRQEAGFLWNIPLEGLLCDKYVPYLYAHYLLFNEWKISVNPSRPGCPHFIEKNTGWEKFHNFFSISVLKERSMLGLLGSPNGRKILQCFPRHKTNHVREKHLN